MNTSDPCAEFNRARLEQHGATNILGRWHGDTTGGHDPVNHPEHYETGAGFECKDVIRVALGDDGFRSFCLGNVIKYVFRHRRKGGTEDLRKAQWYLNAALGEGD